MLCNKTIEIKKFSELLEQKEYFTEILINNICLQLVSITGTTLLQEFCFKITDYESIEDLYRKVFRLNMFLKDQLELHSFSIFINAEGINDFPAQSIYYTCQVTITF